MALNNIKKLADLFSKFPTIGPRTAQRFVNYLIGLKKEETDEIIKAIYELKKNIKICSFCFLPFEAQTNTQQNLCHICANSLRDKSLLCVVEKEADLASIEKTKKYKGYYFILGGTVSGFKKTNIEKLKIKELEARIRENQAIEEIILAINPTPDGEATTLYLERILQNFGKKITRLGRGLPLGGELEYADEETLSFALEGRK